MILSAYTTIEINGLSVTLSVRAPAADLRILLGTEEAYLEDDALQDLFHKSLQETLPALQKFRDALFRNLMTGSTQHLMQKLEEEGILPVKPQEEAA